MENIVTIYNEIIELILAVLTLYREGKTSYLEANYALYFASYEDEKILRELIDFEHMPEEDPSIELKTTNYSKEIRNKHQMLVSEIERAKDNGHTEAMKLLKYAELIKICKW